MSLSSTPVRVVRFGVFESTTFILYTTHLKVHAFIGDHGNIVKTGPVLTIY